MTRLYSLSTTAPAKSPCLYFALTLLLTLGPAHSQPSQLPTLIDREVFFGEPEATGAQLSPDGAYLSFIKPYKSTRNIWVKKREEPFPVARPVTADTTRPIDNYFWSRDGKHLLYVQDKGGNENFNIYAVNPSASLKEGQPVPQARNLTALQGVRAVIYHLPKSDPNVLYWPE